MVALARLQRGPQPQSSGAALQRGLPGDEGQQAHLLQAAAAGRAHRGLEDQRLSMTQRGGDAPI